MPHTGQAAADATGALQTPSAAPAAAPQTATAPVAAPQTATAPHAPQAAASTGRPAAAADRRAQILEACFECFCEHGLEKNNIKQLAAACNMSTANLFNYFSCKDEIIVESTAHCMAKVEEDFMARAPKDFADLDRFLDEMPYITAKEHGTKYRFMYQVYASPHYREEGTKFFQGVTVRYREYAELLAPKLGFPAELLQGFIYIFVRACVHYALFEDEEYLKLQLSAIRTSLSLFMKDKAGMQGKS